MNLTYAVGDIHGCLPELEAMIKNIDDDAAGEPYRLIFVGDYIDRGPNSRGVIDLCMALEARWGKDHVICLMGNHEDMALHDKYNWMMNGGREAEASYPGGTMSHSHREWLKGLRLWYETDTNIFVHAGIYDFEKPMSEQDRHDLLWRRYRNDMGAGTSKVLIHGHTPAREVVIADNRICIDTACVFGGKLTAAKLWEGDGVPICYLEVDRIKNHD